LVLANGLRGNSRLKSLKPRIPSSDEVCNRKFLAIADAVRENEGLIELELWVDGYRLSDEMWDAICDYIKTHPTLEVLNLRTTGGMPLLDPAMLTSRIQTLLDMVKTNTTIHTIYLNSLYSQHELFRGSVISYLETNRFRPRLLAIQKTRPIPYRAKVLGRALMSARTDADSLWMLLSGNVEVAFLSTTVTTRLPTPATAASTSNAAPPVATTAAITRAVSVSGASAATVAIPTAHPKRKARS
jgi:hypothetical protein